MKAMPKYVNPFFNENPFEQVDELVEAMKKQFAFVKQLKENKDPQFKIEALKMHGVCFGLASETSLLQQDILGYIAGNNISMEEIQKSLEEVSKTNSIDSIVENIMNPSKEHKIDKKAN